MCIQSKAAEYLHLEGAPMSVGFKNFKSRYSAASVLNLPVVWLGNALQNSVDEAGEVNPHHAQNVIKHLAELVYRANLVACEIGIDLDAALLRVHDARMATTDYWPMEPVFTDLYENTPVTFK